MTKITEYPANLKYFQRAIILTVGACLVLSYLAWAYVQPHYIVQIAGQNIDLPIPTGDNVLLLKDINSTELSAGLMPELLHDLDSQIIARRAAVRQESIDKVDSFLRSYGSNLAGYGYIFVDQAAACGGDYRILIGIAGSESGLGRINYKLYNPYGYLDGVQYASQEEALTILSCKVSAQHIKPCGEDLYCLAKRYGGPETDLDHFVSKVRYFMNQVD